jgi:hypothetical protein
MRGKMLALFSFLRKWFDRSLSYEYDPRIGAWEWVRRDRYLNLSLEENDR